MHATSMCPCFLANSKAVTPSSATMSSGTDLGYQEKQRNNPSTSEGLNLNSYPLAYKTTVSYTKLTYKYPKKNDKTKQQQKTVSCAPASNKISTISLCPFNAAPCSGTLPPCVHALARQRAASRVRTAWRCPLREARWRGVAPAKVGFSLVAPTCQ